jgi:phosphohistidine phosphatase
MKKLYLIRHAKSDWSGFGESDFERGLNSRGKKDAAKISKKLFGERPIPELIVSSTALRARLTAEIFAENLKLNKNEILFFDQLYHAPAAIIFQTIASLADNFNHIALVCHNPGITDFANQLVSGVHLDNMPTTGVFAVEAATASWATFEDAEKKFLFFERPEKH